MKTSLNQIDIKPAVLSTPFVSNLSDQWTARCDACPFHSSGPAAWLLAAEHFGGAATATQGMESGAWRTVRGHLGHLGHLGIGVTLDIQRICNHISWSSIYSAKCGFWGRCQCWIGWSQILQDWCFAYYLAAGLNLKALHQRWLRSLRQPNEQEESRTAAWSWGHMRTAWKDQTWHTCKAITFDNVVTTRWFALMTTWCSWRLMRKTALSSLLAAWFVGAAPHKKWELLETISRATCPNRWSSPKWKWIFWASPVLPVPYPLLQRPGQKFLPNLLGHWETSRQWIAWPLPTR